LEARVLNFVNHENNSTFCFTATNSTASTGRKLSMGEADRWRLQRKRNCKRNICCS
jgi:hypothetical protein